MDPSKGKQQHSYRGFKSTFSHNFHQENNSYNMPTSHIFKTSKIQRHSLKWRKVHYSRGNYRTRFPYRKSEVNTRKSNKSAEDVEEEERKKKLTDTANKLLSKIKTWNAEKNLSEDEQQENHNDNQEASENNVNHSEEKTSSESKPKRIAHSKKTRLVKNRTPKNFNQPAKTVARYEVNKDTVKDFQNRIQHKLIEEIMQMPKENLQNVLNDPKINPIMELKMSRLVKENKLLIAQKLRALAESKMKLPGSQTNPQLLVDIDKLIDPVIKTDLSVLPFELIKQMENIFQVQFDYSVNTDSQVVCDGAIDSGTGENEIPLEINSEVENIKVESNEDLSLYECSTDEDEENDLKKSLECVVEESAGATGDMDKMQGVKADWKNKRRKHSIEPHGSGVTISVNKEKVSLLQKEPPQEENQPVLTPVEGLSESMRNASSTKSTSGCQTDKNSETASTQTTAVPGSVESLYGVPLPKEATDGCFSALLEEVNSIQKLTNKLNERRFMIFLQLAKMNSTGSFISDETTETNFIETVSNGNLKLVEALKKFFANGEGCGLSNKVGRPPSERYTNRSRHRDDKKTTRNQ